MGRSESPYVLCCQVYDVLSIRDWSLIMRGGGGGG